MSTPKNGKQTYDDQPRRVTSHPPADDWLTAAPPSDSDLESNVLGGIGRDPEKAELLDRVRIEDFLDPRHRMVAAAVKQARGRGLPTDPGHVRDVLTETLPAAQADELADYYRNLVDTTLTAVQLPRQVERLVKLSNERDAKAFFLSLAKMAAQRADLGEISRVAEERLKWYAGRLAAHDDQGVVLTCLADVEPKQVRWLWPGRMPLGRITVLSGRPGEGKSFATIDFASRVTTGTPWPDGTPCPKGSVIFITAEDDPEDTIRPRFDACHGDPTKFHLLSAVRGKADGKDVERMVTLADLPAIEAALKRVCDCKLLVVDPIGSFIGGKTDGHRDNEVRSVLAPIAALAQKYGTAVLVVMHRRKGGSNVADDTALGSRAFTGIARATWHLMRSPDNKQVRHLLPGKNNLSAEGTGLAFIIAGDPARVIWEADPVEMTADDAMAAEHSESKPGPDAEALKAAKDWLLSALADGPRLARDLYQEWEDQKGSEATLKRAKKSLRVHVYRPSVPGPWWWRLPEPKGLKALKREHVEHLGHLEPLGTDDDETEV